MNVAFSQQVRFDRLNVSDGLSQNSVNCMEFDDVGQLWIGTLDGVNCYNGYEFKTYKPFKNSEGSLLGNQVDVLGRGIDGDMWIITRGGGLNWYNAKKSIFKSIDKKHFSPFNIEQIQYLVQQNDSLLWMANQSFIGLFNIKTNQFHRYRLSQILNDFLLTNNGDILAGGTFGIVKFEFDNQTEQFRFEQLEEKPITQFYANKSDVYARIGQEVYLLDHDLKFKKKICNIDAGFSFINDFAITENYCWVSGGGLLRISTNDEEYKYQKFEYDPLNPTSFQGFNVNDILVDDFDNLWIGTTKNGVNHFNNLKNQFSYTRGVFNGNSDPGSNPIRAICEIQSGDLWMAYDRDGLGVQTASNQQKFYKYYFTKNNEKKLIHTVRVIFEDSRLNLWVGVDGDLCLYNAQKDRIETVDCRYGWRWPYRCYSIKELEPGILTITSAVSLGFVNLNDGEMTSSTVSKYIRSVRDCVQDDYRNLWISLDNSGIVKINYPEMNAQYFDAVSSNLSDDKVYCMFAVDSLLWIGTNSGLDIFDINAGKVIKNFYEEDGLSNNVVYSIYPDNNRNLWMSTGKGVSSINMDSYVINTFLPDDLFMDDAHFMTKNGTMHIGGYTGVISFNPNEIKSPDVKLKVAIETVSLFNKPLHLNDTINGKVLYSIEGQQRKINLGYYQNTFSIGFNAYPFDYPNGNLFRYRLKGLHEDWILSSSNKNVTYTKVQPGNYYFQVQASSNLTGYTETTELVVKIKPPFWERLWFRLLGGIIILSFFIGAYRYRVAQINQRNKWLKHKVDEQTSELRSQNAKIKQISEKLHEADESKLRFFTNVSHEFRTPLTLILGQLDNLKGESIHSVKSIKSNALRLMRLIDQVIDLRKMDHDKLNLSVTNFNVVEFVKNIIESFKPLADKKDIDLCFFADNDEMNVWLDADKMEKIVYNLMSNALKYTSNNKIVKVEISEDSQYVNLCFIDEGIGIQANDLDHIFDRFYRSTEGQKKSEGHGIGLAMVKGLTEFQQGKIEVTSEWGVGSCFKVSFLKGKEHFKEIEIQGERFENQILYDDGVHQPVIDEKLGGKKILIVEDNEELRLFLNDMLGAYFSVECAENGEEALSQLNSFAADLIISDIMMPVMDGITFCKQVKLNVETSHIPFILLTAKTDEETKIDGFELGIDAFVEKPFNAKILIARIQGLLSNREKLKHQFDEASQKIPKLNKVSKADQIFIEKINAIVDENYSDNSFSIDKMSEMMNMSRATFYRKFSELTGTAPADYIRKVRLRKAYRLLEDKQQTVTEICEVVGFQSVSHFRKSFKNEFNKTPTQVQKGFN